MVECSVEPVRLPWAASRHGAGKVLIALGVQFAAVVPLAAQQAPELAPVVVTATRTEKAVDDAPIRTEVVGRAELEATKARTLKEALENVPGLVLQEVRGKSGYQVSMQGFGADQVLVLIDGLPISASTGSTVDLSQTLLSGVDRIEVVKGAASAQYGSAAMGGVIHVITRPIAPGVDGRVAAEVGSRGGQNPSGRRVDVAQRRVQGVVEGGAETLRGRLSFERLGDDGFAVDPDGWARQGDEIGRTQIVGRLSWRPTTRLDSWFEAGRYEEHDVQRYTVFVPPVQVPQHKTEAIARDRVAGGARWRLAGGGALDLRAVTERYASDSVALSNGSLVNDRHASQRMGHLSTQLDAPLWHAQLWQVGADLHQESLTQTNNGQSELGLIQRATRSSREIFLQDDILLGDRWEIVPGVRWQDDSDFGGHWAPKVALRGRLIEVEDRTLTFRASLGRGYRVPNLKERHYLFDHASLGYMVIGNPDLRPESSTSGQIGLALALGRRFEIDVNAYENRVRDLIQVDTADAVVTDGVAAYRYRNVASARTRGLETALTWRPDARWTVGAALTLATTRDNATGGELTRRPARVLRVSTDWRMTTQTSLAARVRAQSGELVDSASGGRSPGWATLDLRLTHRLTPRVSLWLALDNVTNRQRVFTDPNDFGPIAGRTVRLGIQAGLGRLSPS